MRRSILGGLVLGLGLAAVSLLIERTAGYDAMLAWSAFVLLVGGAAILGAGGRDKPKGRAS